MNSEAKKCRRGAFIDYLLQREDVKSEWQAYTHHEFVQQLGDGTLPVNRFRDYLIQG
jgi:thiaminase